MLNNADIVRQVLREYGYERTEEVKKTEYDAICSKVEELATQQEGEEGA